MSFHSALDGRIEIGKLPDALLARGVHAFTTQEAAEAAGISPASARPALARLIKNRLVFSPARGLYIAIPPEYRSWGAVPAASFVDALMAHLGRGYYVGYLSAAEVHGAAHQRPQVFQVVVDRELRDREFGRVRMRFVTNRHAGELPTVRVNTPTGTMAVSTPSLTALDLATRPENGAALHNVATVLIELIEDDKLDENALVDLVELFPVAGSRRLGWLVEQFTDLRLNSLAAVLAEAAREPSLLDPSDPRRGPVDRRWQLRINATVEPDL